MTHWNAFQQHTADRELLEKQLHERSII